jgi:copper chaperone
MSSERDTVLVVEGMSCGSCVRHVSEALARLDGVTQVDVQLAEGSARIHHDAARATVTQMLAALDEEGYPAHEKTP